MKHRLLALSTFALSLLGLSALAAPVKNMAPSIKDIPSPIVGNILYQSSTSCIFRDALDLNQYVSDDTTAASDIKWSYAILGTPKYAINGVDPLNIATEDPTNPGAKQINNQVLRGEANTDGKANTITIRNIKLSPFGGEDIWPAERGITDSQVVTLFASDGTTYTAKDLLFFTDVGGQSRLSVPAAAPPTTVPLNTWSWFDYNRYGNMTVTSGTLGSSLCISSPMENGGFGGYASPYGTLPLVDNAVYHISMKLTFTQAQAGALCPFWDLSINNFYVDKQNRAHGFNLYGGDYYFLENEGQAQAVKAASAGGSTSDVWWCPTPIRCPAWKASVFSAANAPNTDAFLQFRVMDVNSSLSAQKAGGTICLEQMTIERYDLTELAQPSALTPVCIQNNFTTTNTTAQMLISGPSGALFSGGTITLTPYSSGQSVEYGRVTPGNPFLDLSNPATLVEDFPITWEPHTLYMTTMTLSAPNANSEQNPFGVFWLAMDSPTNELNGESYVTGSLNKAAMPKQGDPQPYTFFYWSGNGTQSTMVNANRLRWKLAVGNNQAIRFNPNTGSLRIHGVTVSKVSLPG